MKSLQQRKFSSVINVKVSLSKRQIWKIIRRCVAVRWHLERGEGNVSVERNLAKIISGSTDRAVRDGEKASRGIRKKWLEFIEEKE